MGTVLLLNYSEMTPRKLWERTCFLVGLGSHRQRLSREFWLDQYADPLSTFTRRRSGSGVRVLAGTEGSCEQTEDRCRHGRHFCRVAAGVDRNPHAGGKMGDKHNEHNGFGTYQPHPLAKSLAKECSGTGRAELAVIFGGAVPWRIQYRPTGGVAAVTLGMAMLVASARPQDAPKKGESTCADRRASGMDESPVACQDSRNNGPAQVSIEMEKKKRKRNFFRAWLDLADQVQATQPDWLSPLATTSGRLKQEFRYDIWDQPASGGNRSYQFGGNKGLEFIASSRIQILLGVPAYTLVSPNGPPGGFGDLPLMLKFRISSAERAEGNYLVTFILAGTAPTGSQRYGAGEAVVTPTMAFGKGWGDLTCSRPWASICPQETRPSWVGRYCGTRRSNIRPRRNSGPNWK